MKYNFKYKLGLHKYIQRNHVSLTKLFKFTNTLDCSKKKYLKNAKCTLVIMNHCSIIIILLSLLIQLLWIWLDILQYNPVLEYNALGREQSEFGQVKDSG